MLPSKHAVSGLIRRPKIYSELVFIYDVRKESKNPYFLFYFIFLHVDSQLSQDQLLKRQRTKDYSFPAELLCHLGQKSQSQG